MPTSDALRILRSWRALRGAAVAAGLLFASPAAAITLQVDPAQSEVTITLAAVFDGTDVPLATTPSPVTASFSGTVDVAATEAGGAVTSLQVLTSALGLSNTAFQVTSPPIAQLVVGTSGVGLANFLTGVYTASSIAGGVSTFDVSGAQGIFDHGLLLAQGLMLNAPVSVSVDLSQSPLTFTLDPGTTATAVLGAHGLTVTVPLATSALLPITGLPPGVQVRQDLQGRIVMTNVPEPGTLALLGAGGVGLALRRHRRH